MAASLAVVVAYPEKDLRWVRQLVVGRRCVASQESFVTGPRLGVKCLADGDRSIDVLEHCRKTVIVRVQQLPLD